MSQAQLLVAVSAVALVSGLALIWSGFHVNATGTTPHRRADVVPVAAGAVVTLIAYALSGWAIAALVAGGLVAWFAQRIRGRARTPVDETAKVEALASWVENVRDVLQAAGQPIGAIGITADTCPLVIRGQVRALFARMSAGQPPAVAFRRFADEIDDPLGDLIATGLLIAVTRGAQTEHVLSALATQARHQADRRRIVEAERAPMRHQVLAVSLIMIGLLAAVFIFGRSSYLDAYDTTAGQAVLAIILIGYAALLVRVGALSRFPKPSRFLTLDGDR